MPKKRTVDPSQFIWCIMQLRSDDRKNKLPRYMWYSSEARACHQIQFAQAFLHFDVSRILCYQINIFTTLPDIFNRQKYTSLLLRIKKWSCTNLQIIPKDWTYRFAEQVNWWITVIIYFFIHVIKRGVCDAMFPRCTIFKYPQCEVSELPNMMSSPDAPVSRSLLAMLPKLTYQAVYPSQCVYRHLARVCTTDWIVPESLRGPSSQLSQFTQRLWFKWLFTALPVSLSLFGGSSQKNAHVFCAH